MKIKKKKSAIAQSPALGHPNYQLPFSLFALEDRRFALSILTQRHGDPYGPIGYSGPGVRFVTEGRFSHLLLNRQ